MIEWRRSDVQLTGWQSSDGLITPVSFSGRSPLHTPASLKAFSPLHTASSPLCTPQRTPSTLQSPLCTPSTQRTARIRKTSFRGSDSMFTFRLNSPRRVLTPVPGGAPGATGTMTDTAPRSSSRASTRRFHSIPRSSTTDGLSSNNLER
ncbi:uncharacterized protein LOC111697099 [Eurytemora carolleeae]|uniref:uncharacterized protein LOC111697099 n=1 Tax=Eurytemora carolleeae TaxID=1294199 RepID=UPI000C780096|nr:uncharacterized protein LOC111697099 [Eurytemora carolleeae]|eukprot:XP_023322760.1 uncharacterized protein LOC111697099 [Eurytemora affinis]